MRHDFMFQDDLTQFRRTHTLDRFVVDRSSKWGQELILFPLLVLLLASGPLQGQEVGGLGAPAPGTTPVPDGDFQVLPPVDVVAEPVPTPPTSATATATDTGSGVGSRSSADAGIPSIPTQPLPLDNPFPGNPLPNNYSVTATRTVSPLPNFGGTLRTLTGNQLQQLQQPLVADALRQLPGLEVVRSGGPGRITSLFLRGAESNFTKVLLDGIPLNDPSSPGRAFNFGDFTTDGLERVEVLYGPQSTLYGSDALGGVVNFVTLRGNGPLAVRFSSEAGSYGTTIQRFTASAGNERYYYSFAGSYFLQNGFSAASERFGNIENDGYHNGTFSSRVGFNPTEELNFDFVVRYINAAADIDGFNDFGIPTDDPFRLNTSEYVYSRSQATLNLLDDRWTQRVGFSFNNSNRYDSNPGFFGDPVFHGQIRQFDYQSNFFVGQADRLATTLTLGTDYRQEEADTASLGKQRLWNSALYLQSQIDVADRWFTTLGVRWDDYSTAGPAFTYRATSLFRLKETGTAFRGSIGTAFIAPSLFDLFGTFGNPALRPEESKGWDYGIEQRLFDDTVFLSATYFRNDFENLIDFGPPPTFAPINIGQALTTGVEVVARVQLDDDTAIYSSYTRTDARNRDTDQPLLRRPRDRATFSLVRDFLDDRAQLVLSMRYVHRKFDFLGFNPGLLEDYTVFDLAGTYRIRENIRLFGRIDNLFDENYEETFGFATPRFSGYGGIELLFGGPNRRQPCLPCNGLCAYPEIYAVDANGMCAAAEQRLGQLLRTQ